MLQCRGVMLILPDVVAGGWGTPWRLGGEGLSSTMMSYVWSCLKTALKKKRKTEGSIHPSSDVFRQLRPNSHMRTRHFKGQLCWHWVCYSFMSVQLPGKHRGCSVLQNDTVICTMWDEDTAAIAKEQSRRGDEWPQKWHRGSTCSTTTHAASQLLSAIE